jgi:two-component system phosphate regulon response regulator OmpR
MSESEPHLLVVDDDARLRDLLRRYLSDNGFRVTGAADAQQARGQLASFDFDLIVLDVMMPGESGLDLTRALRAEGTGSGTVPVLLLTAMAEPEDRINGLEQGADDYLVKPFEPRELLLRIRNILQRRLLPAEMPPPDIRFAGYRFDLTRSRDRPAGEPCRARAAAGLARGAVAVGAVQRQRPQRRRAGHPAAPQDRARSAQPALPADGARHRLCAAAGLTGRTR